MIGMVIFWGLAIAFMIYAPGWVSIGIALLVTALILMGRG